MGGIAKTLFGGGQKTPTYDYEASARAREQAAAEAKAKDRADEQKREEETRKASAEALDVAKQKRTGVLSTLAAGGSGLDDDAVTLKKKLGA